MKTRPPSETTRFYDANAETFRDRTVALDMTELYEPFLERLEPEAHILDAGCGPGRDIKNLSDLGYRVTGLDASAEMVRLARELSGQTVHHMPFQAIEWTEVFDGVWACASLLHVPKGELPTVFNNITQAMKPGGTFYCSFKYGKGERKRGARAFTDLDEKGLGALVARTPGLATVRWWRSEDVRDDHHGEFWLNALLEKQP